MTNEITHGVVPSEEIVINCLKKWLEKSGRDATQNVTSTAPSATGELSEDELSDIADQASNRPKNLGC